MSIDVRRLRQDDVLLAFRCGDHRLDHFFKKYAKANQAAHESSTWVAAEADLIVGFVTIVPCSVGPESLRAVLPDRPDLPAPALLLGRMGIDKRHQRKGIGRLLLRAAYEAAVHQAQIACVGVFVHAKPGAVAFYERVGFVALEAPADPSAPTSMFTPLERVSRELTEMTQAASPEAP